MAFSPEAAFQFLQRAHQSGRLAHAYLITGEEGSGKRALALRLAALATGSQRDPLTHPDVHSLEPESKSRVIKVEQTRELEKELQMRSSQSALKVGILFDADRMNDSAANSFLKTLEEPPENCLLLLVTAHPEMLLETILSRCISVPLEAPPRREPVGEQKQLLDMLARFCKNPQPGLGEVFALVRAFGQLLSNAKTAIQDEGESAFKQEEKLYKKTTDGKWLDDREEYFKALAESRYLQARTRHTATLLQWWGDILRQQHGAAALDFPTYANDTAEIAQRLPQEEVLRRLSALETLRENFTRNVQEQLALEVAFLNAFGG